MQMMQAQQVQTRKRMMPARSPEDRSSALGHAAGATVLPKLPPNSSFCCCFCRSCTSLLAWQYRWPKRGLRAALQGGYCRRGGDMLYSAAKRLCRHRW